MDVDPTVNPDICATITDLHEVKSGSVHAIYISHCLEHVPEVEGWRAVQEMMRVLDPETGFVYCLVPNLRKACQWVAEGGIMETAYWSQAGPIRPIDMLYGWQPPIAEGKVYMTHRFGYTGESLGQLFQRAGFGDIRLVETSDEWELTCLAFVKEKASGDDVGGREAVCGASERGAGES